jgi:hypothetical protein
VVTSSSVEREVLLDYVTRLTGLPSERVTAAQEQLRALSIPHLDAELLNEPTVDAVVASTLLADSLDDVVAAGVPHTKLVSKLRNDHEVWSAWAELRAASQLSRYLETGAQIVLEPARAKGRHPDFRVSSRDGPPFAFLPLGEASDVSIEFKALGLSDEEAAFCFRATATLRQLRPTAGFMTLHAPLDFVGAVKMNRAERRDAAKRASQTERRVPEHARGISGVVVVARGTEEPYLHRLRMRLKEALGQLPPHHECWVAFHWSNGAPFHLVAEALRDVALPTNVGGVLLIGSAVVFPIPTSITSWRGEPCQASEAKGSSSTLV